MYKQERCNTQQADGVAQEPSPRGRLVFRLRNTVISKEARDTDDCCHASRCRAHQNIANDVSSSAQPEVDLCRAAQCACSCAVTNSNAHGIECAAKRQDWLRVKEFSCQSIRETD